LNLNRIKRTSILFLIITLLVFPILVSAQLEDAGNVHGYVVDEEGTPLKNVKVNAISNSGNVQATDQTDEDGFYRFALEKETYTILIEKQGYATEEVRITVPRAGWWNDPESDSVKMGEITLEKAIKLSTTALSRVTSPGQTLDIAFTVTNNAETLQTVDFTVSLPEYWSAQIYDSTSEVNQIQVAPGSTQLTLRLKIPQSMNQTEKIALTATSTLSDTIEITINPRTSDDDIELKTTYTSISEETGRTINLPLKIKNNGEVDKNIKLSTTVPENWSVNILTNNQMAVSSILVEPAETYILTVEVKPADDAATGEYRIIISALSENDITQDTVSISINLREPTSDVEVISTFTDVTIEAGGSISFPLAIWNRGGTDALALLSVESVPSNWDTVFITDEVKVSSVLVGADESSTLEFKVKPPNSVETGEYTLNVVIETSAGFQEVIPLKVTVEGSYELELELSTLYTTTRIGDSVSFSAQVTNMGATPVTTIYLDFVLPEDWETTYNPVQVSSLDPRDSVRFNIVAETSSDTEAGDYLLTVQAISDQLVSEELDIRITAQASTTWGYIGFGLAGVFVAGAYLLFKRFKRR
jgi:uncharacterized membrane protein